MSSPSAVVMPLEQPKKTGQKDVSQGSVTSSHGQFSCVNGASSAPGRPIQREWNLRYLAIGSVIMQIEEPCKVSNVWAHLPLDFHVSLGHDLISTSALSKLLSARWAQADFKRHNKFTDRISIRVFLLPDDIGRSTILREDLGLRKAMWELISGLDKSLTAWEGNGSIDQPATSYITTPTNESLFYMFNNLEDPSPKSSIVSDVFSQDAMDALLDSSKCIQGLKNQLFGYQRRSAAVMIQREVQPGKILDPRFKRRIGPTGEVFYLDERTGCLLSERREYDEARGGILAETMGVGKTLICLALILSTKGHWPRIPPEYSTNLHPVRPRVGRLMETAAAAMAQNQIPWKAYFEDKIREGQHYKRCIEALQSQIGFYSIPPKASRVRKSSNLVTDTIIKLCSATLIIVPANLLAQWKQEIAFHVEKGFLSVLIIDDLLTAMPNSSRLLQYDIILMERRRFERESTSDESFDIKPVAEPLQNDCGNSHSERRGHDKLKTVYESHRAFAGCCCSYTANAHSPLRCLHFLRLIVDEGHNFAASGMNSISAICMQKLHVDRRWIVSGTPANGLLGAEIDLATKDVSPTPASTVHVRAGQVIGKVSSAYVVGKPSEATFKYEGTGRTLARASSAFSQETKDLKSLGNIVVNFLALPPWANLKSSPDYVSWDWYVIPAKGCEERDSQTLRNVLASLIVRHRLDTVQPEIQLPELHNRVIYLQPCYFDKLSINLFLLKLASNAVTSERIDRDYMFHPNNRKQLDILISNLRKSCFFWTGFTAEDVHETIQLSRNYIEKKGKELSREDACLMENAIEAGLKSLDSPLWHALSKYDEIGLCIRGFPAEASESWSLTNTKDSCDCVIGATQVGRAVKFIDDRLCMRNPTEEFTQAGAVEMQKAETEASKHTKSKTKSALAGVSPHKIKAKASKHQALAAISTTFQKTNRQPLSDNEAAPYFAKGSPPIRNDVLMSTQPTLKPVNTINPPLSNASALLLQTRLAATVSAKLSYLLDRVIELQEKEKILIFYEGDHIAYYIAQALEIIGVEHLIYVNSLEVAKRNEYIMTFTNTEVFRVMLMDLRQAAHGLHVACASRVFFVNPVWQPNVEAQAIKRAHRIGQTRPVYVETLVLENTLEDQMLQRRKAMTMGELREASKSLLDDSTMNAIIKKAQFIPFLDRELNDASFCFAPLRIPQQIFGRKSNLPGAEASAVSSAGLHAAHAAHAAEVGTNAGRKRVAFVADANDADVTTISKRRKMRVTFAI